MDILSGTRWLFQLPCEYEALSQEPVSAEIACITFDKHASQIILCVVALRPA